MSASEMCCGKEEKGKEDMEEEGAPAVNMDGETKAEAKDPPFSLSENNQGEKASENVDLLSENNDAMSVGLPGSFDNQTPDDARVNTNVDRFDGNGKNSKLEFLCNKGKGPESIANKTDNNASVDVIAKEQSCSKSDGSLLHPLNQLQCVAADERLSKMEVEIGEKGEKLDDASVVDVSVNELSGTKIDGSHVQIQQECAAANERSPKIKSENDETREKFDAASVVDSKSDGSLVDRLNQLERATVDEKPSEIKAANDEKWEKLGDASAVDVSANELSGSKIDGIGSPVHTLNQPGYAAADERSSELKSKNDGKGEKLDDHISENDEKGEKLDDASIFHASSNELSGIKNYGSRVYATTATDERSLEKKDEDYERGKILKDGVADMELTLESEVKESKPKVQKTNKRHLLRR